MSSIWSIVLPSDNSLDIGSINFSAPLTPAIFLARFQPLTLSIGDIGISTITLAELRYGVEKSQSIEKNRQALEAFLRPLEILDFDESAASAYGVVRTALERAGNPIGPLDTQIGAHALSVDAFLVTNNTKEFRRIKGLKVANWLN